MLCLGRLLWLGLGHGNRHRLGGLRPLAPRGTPLGVTDGGQEAENKDVCKLHVEWL